LHIRTEVIQTDRLNFQCRVAGSRRDLPVLLVHGSFGTSRWWEPFMHLLADGFFLVAPDLRGCGATSSVEQPSADTAGTSDATEAYAIENQAADLAALVAALGWDEFDLVGHSSGGAIAIEYALSFPHRVRTLTLVDSAPIEGVFTPVDMYILLEQMRTDRALLRQALAALMPTYPIQASNSPQPPEYKPAENTDLSQAQFFNQLVEDALHMAPAAFTAGAEALNRWNRFADAGSLTMPTLLIWGELDTIVDRDSTTRMLIAIPGAHNLEVLRNVGHSPMIEAPVALAERFIEFITDDLDDFEQVRRDALE
jgi:3-oxoadipate enol-lactonase